MAKEFTLMGEVGWEIDTYMVRNILAQAKGEDINVNISSPGGSVFMGIEIFNLFKMYSGNVSFHIIGEASSIMSYIVLSGEGLPTAEPNATFFIHNARTGVYGDHFAMRKRADTIEGLSRIITNTYIEKSGLEREAVEQMMKDETFFFGQEIVSAGFVSSISGSDKVDISPEAKQSAVALATERYEACMKRVEAERPEDYEQAAALLTEFKAVHKPRIIAEKPKKEQISMNLEQFLAENPAEKKKHDAAMKTAIDAVRAENTAIIAKVTPIIASADYAKCMPTAMKVLSGEASIVALDSVVAMVDMEIEAKKQADATNEPALETPPNGQPVAVASADGMINSEDDYQASLKEERKQLGLED